MTEALDQIESLTCVLVFFFHDKSVVVTNNDWNDMTFKECYIKPVKILEKDNIGVFTRILFQILTPR